MPTLSAGSTATDIIQPGQALTVTCAADATASVVEVGAPGAAPGTPTAVAAGGSYLAHAPTAPRHFRIHAAGGAVTYAVIDFPPGLSLIDLSKMPLCANVGDAVLAGVPVGGFFRYNDGNVAGFDFIAVRVE